MSIHAQTASRAAYCRHQGPSRGQLHPGDVGHGEARPRTVSTSYVERQNLTMRMQMRWFTRLTNAFSKKAENHAHAVALHFVHYNFCRPQQTLTRRAKGIYRTPAMAAGLTDRV